MAEINFGILDTQSPAKIGNAFVRTPEQQNANMLQVMQMKHLIDQSDQAQYAINKARREDTGMAEFGNAIKALGPDPSLLAIAQVFMKHPNPEYQLKGLELGKQARADQGYRDLGPISAPAARPAVAPAPGSFGENMLANRAALPSFGDKQSDVTAGSFAPAAPMTEEGRIAEIQPRLALLRPFIKDNPQAKAEYDLLADELKELRKPETIAPGSIRRKAGYATFTAPAAPSATTRMQAELDAMLSNDPARPALQAQVNSALVLQQQAAERLKIQWGTLNVAQKNLAVNQARLELAQNAPKLGLTDPEDIQRVAVATANGRIIVDRLTPQTAMLYAKLLKANPDLDFTKTSIDQAVAKTGAVTTARIGAEQLRTTSLTPEMLKQFGEAYNTNGKLPSLGSGPQAAVDRVAVLRYASENNPTDATTKALNKAQLDALVPLAKQEAAVTNYVKTFDKNIELARAALTKVSNTNIPALNAWLLNPAQRQLTGDPDLKALGVYVSSLQAEFAKIQSGAMGNSVTADAAIKRAQDTINTADSPRAFRAALDAMVKESRNRLDSFEDTRKEMAAKVRGQPALATPAAATPSPGWGKAEAK